MSRHAPQYSHLSEVFSEEALRIVIVASEYNASFVNAMLEQAQTELKAALPSIKIDIVRVPGALEIPLLVKLAAEQHHPSAIIALGVIIRGATAHADLVGEATTQALMSLSLDYSVPVIHEVLLLGSEKEAEERCLGSGLNRGAEAARSALATVAAVKSICKKLINEEKGSSVE